jgi:hypothetical protein
MKAVERKVQSACQCVKVFQDGRREAVMGDAYDAEIKPGWVCGTYIQPDKMIFVSG